MDKIKNKSNKLIIFGYYEFIVSTIIVILSINIYISDTISQILLPYGLFVAIIGLIGGALLIKNLNIGFYFSLLWSIIQIFNFQIGSHVVNLTQFIFLLFPIRIMDIAPYPDILININIIGIFLLIILILLRKELK